MAGDKKKNCNLGSSVFFLALKISFQQNYHNNQLVVTPNEMVGLYCID